MRLERVWAMPSGATFTVPPIRLLLDRIKTAEGVWADPFGDGLEAKSLLEGMAPGSLDGILLDPPYSLRQAHELYNGRMCLGITAIYDLAASRLRLGGLAVCFGWNSNGLGKGRGFVLEEVLLVAHGAQHNDTIVTIERKVAAPPGSAPEGETR
jgi:hypothetical protein